MHNYLFVHYIYCADAKSPPLLYLNKFFEKKL
jgi:hypothetical protein